MYKSKLKDGTTFFDGFSVSWSSATQDELKKVFELGYTKFVSKEDAKPKKKSKAKEESVKNSSS